MPDAPDLYPGLLLHPSEVGALRWRERVTPPATFTVSYLGVAVVLALVLVPLQGWGALGGPAGVLLTIAMLTVSHATEVYRVHERGLVTRLYWKTPYVVPWESVDPALVRLHTRANFLGRRVGVDPQRSWRQPVWSRNVISLVGLDPDYASPKRRAGRLEDVRAMLRRGQPLMPLPLTTWYFGPRRPEPMLRALEAALLAAGRPGASGLTDRCLAAPVRESYRHPPTQEQVYGGPPPRRLPGHRTAATTAVPRAPEGRHPGGADTS